MRVNSGKPRDFVRSEIPPGDPAWGPASRGRAALALAATTIGAMLATVPSGCGASYQAMYEGEVRFEHCYRLDEEPSVPVPQRRECWREWTQFYTFGQTRDRIEYALMRQRLLAGVGSAPVPGPDGDAGVLPAAPLAAPPPTNPFAPPPQIESTTPNPALDAGPIDADPRATQDDVLDMLANGTAPPGQSCLLRCVATWKKCVGNCLVGNARCKAVCDTAFKTCARGCV